MKNLFKNFCRAILPVAMLFAAVGCEEAGLDGEGTGTAKIAISDVEPTYSSVSFNVKSEGANAIACMALESDKSAPTAEAVFNDGVAKGSAEASFVLSDLASDTEYTLYVAVNTTAGFEGPEAKTFKTLVNTGEPETPVSAGIRLESATSDGLLWEVSNGDQVDFTYVMVRPTILMENMVFEASKAGVSEDDCISNFILTYGYLCKTLVGAGVSDIFDYDTFNQEVATLDLFPDANYTIYALSCEGDIDDETTTRVLDLTSLDVSTLPIKRTGDPHVNVECTERGYMALRYYVTPNAAAAYWTKFFTKTSEISEFRKHYDELLGEGMGDVKLKEYLQHADPYIMEQTEAGELITPLGFDQEGIDFSRLVLGYDYNLVPGDDYMEVIDQVTPMDQEYGDFSMEVTDIGAGNMFLNATLEGNCMQAHWAMYPAGSMDDVLADEKKSTELGRFLWDQAWTIWRWNEPNEDHDVVYNHRAFHFGEARDAELDLIATSVGYGGAIKPAEKLATFKTLPQTLGDYEPVLDIVPVTISKTKVIVEYQVNDDVTNESDRLFYHRILVKDNDLVDYTDDEIRDWLLADDAAYSNVWSVLSSDSQDEDDHNYRWAWAGMESGVEYVYYWVTENAAGEVSNLKKLEFTTVLNDGGPNPAIDIDIDPETILTNPADQTFNPEVANQYGATASMLPNMDVIAYNYLFIDESALRSFTFDPDNEDSLHKGLVALFAGQGMPAIEALDIKSYQFNKDDSVWVIAQGYGSNGAQSDYTVVRFDWDKNVDEAFILPYEDYNTASVAPAAKTIGRSLGVSRFDSVTKGGSPAAIAPKNILLIDEPKAEPEVDGAALRAQGIPYYSFEERTLRALTGGREE